MKTARSFACQGPDMERRDALLKKLIFAAGLLGLGCGFAHAESVEEIFPGRTSGQCPNTVVGTKTIEGLYTGWFNQKIQAVGIEVRSGKQPVFIAAKKGEAEKLFGGKKGRPFSVTYKIEQRWWDSEKLCYQYKVIVNARPIAALKQQEQPQTAPEQPQAPVKDAAQEPVKAQDAAKTQEPVQTPEPVKAQDAAGPQETVQPPEPVKVQEQPREPMSKAAPIREENAAREAGKAQPLAGGEAAKEAENAARPSHAPTPQP